MYPTKPTGDDVISESYIFADNNVLKEPMSSDEILEGYNNKGESETELTSIPDANKFNSFWYQLHNTLVWVIEYIEELYTAKLEKSGGTMTGTLAMGSNKITSSYTPVDNADLTNKEYVDTAVSGAMWLGETKWLSYPTIPTLPSGMEVVNADGRALSRTTYSTYFSLIGTTYGVGDGSTTFNIPNLLGKYQVGWDSVGTLDPGRTYGSDQKRESSKYIKKYDWANPVTRTHNTLYTATEDGIVYWWGGNTSLKQYILDGVAYPVHTTTQGQTLGFQFPVSKGQTWQTTGGDGAQTIKFVPQALSSENSSFTQTNIAMYPVVRIK